MLTLITSSVLQCCWACLQALGSNRRTAQDLFILMICQTSKASQDQPYGVIDMWQVLIPAVTSIIDKIIPDPQASAEAKLKMLELAQKGELAELQAATELAKGQMEINKIEAASDDPFRAGWRPAAGWICVFGLGYTFLARPLLPWIAATFGLNVTPLPPIDTVELMALLGGMLGLGGMRSAEKIKSGRI